ncbi:non-canonical purine NTP pyrophosphatase [bacterium]|nr:non-canonical purine NTP pyrophosphatase [bacterium]
MKLIFATGNRGKLKEAEEILTSFELISIKEYAPSFDPVESGNSFLQNAIIKAEAAQQECPGEIVLADDSGLIVDALDGAPGIYSSRFSGRRCNRQIK